MSLNACIIGLGRKGFNSLIDIYCLCHGSLKKKIVNIIIGCISLVKIWVSVLNAVHLLTVPLVVSPVESGLPFELNRNMLKIRNLFWKNRSSSTNYNITSEEKKGFVSNVVHYLTDPRHTLAENAVKNEEQSNMSAMVQELLRLLKSVDMPHYQSCLGASLNAFDVGVTSTKLWRSIIKTGKALKNLKELPILNSINKFLTPKETTSKLPVKCAIHYIMQRGGLVPIG